MSASADLTPSKAANMILRWMRVADEEKAAYIDLDRVREGLPTTPYGEGVKIIKPPMASTVSSVEGMLVCNPNDPAEWGIFYNPAANPERQRFTIAHELGHFKLHHVIKRIAMIFVLSLGFLALLGYLKNQVWFYQGLGVQPLPTSR